MGKKIVTAALLAFVVVSMTVIGVRAFMNGAPPDGEVSEPVPSRLLAPDADIDVVYYFMTHQRCANCVKIEMFTREAVEGGFADRLADGSLVFKIVMVDSRENSHFIDRYKLFTKSVVLSRYRGGKEVSWKNLDQVWNLLDDRDAFVDYVTGELTSFLGGEG